MEKYTMLDYIKEAPEVALNNVEHYQELVKPLLDIANEKEYKRIWLVASGSSNNACHCARAFMKKVLPMDVKIITPYTFTYYEHDINEDDLVLVVTQSGYSTNAIEAIKKINELNHLSICLTGNVNSDVKDYADVVIDYGVQEELVGYVTKGVTCLCLFLVLFSIAQSKQTDYLDEVKKAIQVNQKTIDKTMKFIEHNYKELTSMNWVYSIGAGSNYGTALESALKMGETIHIPSAPYEIEEYIHGPNLQLTPQYNVFIYDGNDQASNRVAQVYLATKQVTNRVFMVSANTNFKDDDHVLLVDKVLPELCPIAYLPFVQLVSYIISRDTNRIKQHPLLKKFKKIAAAKSDNFVNYDEDE
ncbi:SIS domain-containing protein [Floccifex sp.]|uniref:SIS domain-containing protein n=1 Tax=Floccifex sp. TaxID=2815810 RepID=UPI003F0E3E5D